MRGSVFVCLAAVCAGVLVGCNSKDTALSAANLASDVAKSSKENASNAFLVGSWKGELKMPEMANDDIGSAFAKGMGDMLAGTMKLEIMEGDKFRLSAMGFPIDGTFTREGSSLRLTPDKVMGMTVDDFKKMAEANGKKAPAEDEFTKPLTLTISVDGKELTMEPEKGQEESGSLVFTRDTSVIKQGRLTPQTGSNGEPGPTGSIDTSVVGSYGAELKVDESKLSASEKSELPMMKAMLESSSLEIASDGTFRMTLVVDASGTWKVESGILTLTVTSAMGMQTTKSDPLQMQVMDGGRRLRVIKNANEAASPVDEMFFVKK